MTPYADMTELQRVQMLARFCGYDYGVERDGLGGVIRVRERTSVGIKGPIWDEWNPFKDPAALEEVEAAIRNEATWFHIKWFKGFTFPFTAMYRKDEEHIIEGADTKADAIAQVVWALVERKG